MPLSELSIRIDKDSAVPIYFQLYEGMRSLIAAGSLKPGDALPSETDFARYFSISPMTVRQAMTELVKEGFINRQRGRGSFVAPRQLDHPLDRMVSFSEDMLARQVIPGSRVLLIEEVAAPLEIAAAADLPAGVSLLRLKRVRYANGEPVGIHDAYLHQVSLTEADLDKTPSLYMLLAQRGIVIAEGLDTIESVSAPKEAADLLGIRVNAPMLQTTRISWDEQGRFVEYVVALYRADLYHYRIRLRRS